LNKFQELKLSYNQIRELPSSKLRSLLFPEKEKTNKPKVQPDWDYIFKESQRKHLTLQQLWYEFKAANPKGVENDTQES
jgi:transposase